MVRDIQGQVLQQIDLMQPFYPPPPAAFGDVLGTAGAHELFRAYT